MCPSPGSRFRPWSAQWLPTSCLVQNDSRVPISGACSNAIERFGQQAMIRASSGTASRRGDTGGSPTFKRGSFLLSLITADGIQPRLSRLSLNLGFRRDRDARGPEDSSEYAVAVDDQVFQRAQRMKEQKRCQLRLKNSHFCRSKISHFERAVVPPDAVFGGTDLVEL